MTASAHPATVDGDPGYDEAPTLTLTRPGHA